MTFNLQQATAMDPGMESSGKGPLEQLQGVLERNGILSVPVQSPPAPTPPVLPDSSGGKPRKHRCKTCGFVAFTKTEHWEHAATHIKAEKMLKCNHCPFVTEYKHHLEYHVRNHFNCKPFKCDKCNYNCVNKSMLNSHMKSHSNVYQYRCADCEYATKYCHSLKLHLRRNNHMPALVLNEDGTQNFDSIIDVYGTRRGPRSKKKKSEDKSDQHSPQNLALTPRPPFPFPLTYPPPLLPLFYQGFQSLLPQRDMIFPHEGRQEFSCPRCEYKTPERDELTRHFEQHARAESSSPRIKFEEEEEERHSPSPSPLDMTRSSTPCDEGPLDLSKAYRKPEVTGSSRRKGKAFKLSRAYIEWYQGSGEDEEEEEEEPKPGLQTYSEMYSSLEQHEKGDLLINHHITNGYYDDHNRDQAEPIRRNGENKTWDDANCCPYCKMAFKDRMMFKLHMKYHGFQDPFTCNFCGKKYQDPVEFYMHFLQTPHC